MHKYVLVLWNLGPRDYISIAYLRVSQREICRRSFQVVDAWGSGWPNGD